MIVHEMKRVDSDKTPHWAQYFLDWVSEIAGICRCLRIKNPQFL